MDDSKIHISIHPQEKGKSIFDWRIHLIKKLLAEELMNFGPIMHKKFHTGVWSEGITKQQAHLLFAVFFEDGKTMKYYGDKMMVSKSSITILADKLIEEQYLMRSENIEDRRENLLNITEQGKQFINKQKERVKDAVIKKFEALSEEEIRKLYDSICTIIEISRKMG